MFSTQVLRHHCSELQAVGQALCSACSRLRLTLLQWLEINEKNVFKSKVLHVSTRNLQQHRKEQSYPTLLLCGKEQRAGKESAVLDFLAAVPSRRKLINQCDMGVIYSSSCLPENTDHLVLVMKGRLATNPGDRSLPDRLKENATCMKHFLPGVNESIPQSCQISYDDKKKTKTSKLQT